MNIQNIEISEFMFDKDGSMKSYLLLDTCNQWLSCGIASGNTLKYITQESNQNSFDVLYLQIDALLQATELEKVDGIVTCIGPGSFIGSRLCVSTARNLAQMWDIPIFPIESNLFYLYSALSQNLTRIHESMSRGPSNEIKEFHCVFYAKQAKVHGISIQLNGLRSQTLSTLLDHSKNKKETFLQYKKIYSDFFNADNIAEPVYESPLKILNSIQRDAFICVESSETIVNYLQQETKSLTLTDLPANLQPNNWIPFEIPSMLDLLELSQIYATSQSWKKWTQITPKYTHSIENLFTPKKKAI